MSFLLAGRLGAAPYDAMTAGLAKLLGLAVGSCSWLEGVALVLAAWMLGRRPRLGTLVATVLVGLVINEVLAELRLGPGLVARVAIAVLGLLVLWAGVGLVVAADLGAGCVEELMLAITARGLKLHRTRWVMEIVLIVAALAVSGAIGIFTVIFLLATGPVLSLVLLKVAALVRLPGDRSLLKEKVELELR